jgi:hypothetical protein
MRWTNSQDEAYLAAGDTNLHSYPLWEVGSGTCVDMLRAELPYAGLNLTGATGPTEAQWAALKALGTVEDDRIALAGHSQLETPLPLVG